MVLHGPSIPNRRRYHPAPRGSAIKSIVSAMSDIPAGKQIAFLQLKTVVSDFGAVSDELFKLTRYLYLVPRLRMGGDILPHPYTSSYHSDV
jgi:hypothetical protein